MIMIHDYDNDCESGDPKMEYLDGGDDDYNYDSLLVLSLFSSGDPDNEVLGRRR